MTIIMMIKMESLFNAIRHSLPSINIATAWTYTAVGFDKFQTPYFHSLCSSLFVLSINFLLPLWQLFCSSDLHHSITNFNKFHILCIHLFCNSLLPHYVTAFVQYHALYFKLSGSCLSHHSLSILVIFHVLLLQLCCSRLFVSLLLPLINFHLHLFQLYRSCLFGTLLLKKSMCLIWL